jgi:hypothetical protein
VLKTKIDEREWLKDNYFLRQFSDCDFTIEEFLFEYHKDEETVLILQSSFEYFINKYLYNAMENKTISIDLVLFLIGIKDIIEYMTDRLLKHVKDDKVFAFNAIDTLIDIIVKESKSEESNY